MGEDSLVQEKSLAQGGLGYTAVPQGPVLFAHTG